MSIAAQPCTCDFGHGVCGMHGELGKAAWELREQGLANMRAEVERLREALDRAGRELTASNLERNALRETVGRVYRDRREPDKVLAYCLAARPDLTSSVASSREDKT